MDLICQGGELIIKGSDGKILMRGSSDNVDELAAALEVPPLEIGKYVSEHFTPWQQMYIEAVATIEDLGASMRKACPWGGSIGGES